MTQFGWTIVRGGKENNKLHKFSDIRASDIEPVTTKVAASSEIITEKPLITWNHFDFDEPGMKIDNKQLTATSTY